MKNFIKTSLNFFRRNATPPLPAEWQEEFRAEFERPGIFCLRMTSFFCVFAFLSFWLIDFFIGALPLVGGAQTVRLLVIITYTAVFFLTFFAQEWTRRNYRWFYALVLFVALQLVCWVSINVRLNAPIVELYWSLSTSLMTGTIVALGFSRLNWKLGLFISLSALLSGIWQISLLPVVPVSQLTRFVVHLTIINIVCVFLNKTIEDNIKSLFILAKDNLGRNKYAEELKAAKIAAEEGSRAKSAFLANISHEIRTPMNGIIGTLDMMSRTKLSEENQHLLKIARASGMGLLKIINDVLDFAKVDVTKVKLNVEPFDLRTTVQAAIDVFHGTALSKNITVRTDFSGVDTQIDTLYGDEVKLSQVILNLVSNAIKFTSEGSVEAIVSAQKSSEDSRAAITIKIKDTGVGIPSAAQKFLFQPFYQVDSGDRRKYGGTGLGLATSKQIIEAMHGTISLESEEWNGATFTVRLELPFSTHASPQPAQKTEVPHQPDDAGENILIKTEEQNAHSENTGLKKRVLLAEDNLINAMVTSSFINSLGMRCEHVINGEEAVNLYQKERFDLCLMDIEMPVMDGYEATKKIRLFEKEQGLYTPIIAVTARALAGDKEACLAVGMDDYLTKPLVSEHANLVLTKWLAHAENSRH